jgi:uncharacterized integral membrane protein (TIGR00698 family)
MNQRITEYFIGLSLLFILGIISRVVAKLIPNMNYIIVAIIAGVAIANTTGIPSSAKAGVGLYALFLETGIILMGAQIDIGAIFNTGAIIVTLVVLFIVFSLLYVETLGIMLFDTSKKLDSLLAAGVSICGVSAVVAVSGIIKPDEDQLAYAIATILIFDVVTLFLFPILGEILNLSEVVFGVWAGISMFSTGPVAAAGYEYSEVAGQWALLTKLARNTFIGIIAALYAIYYTKQGTSNTKSQWRTVWEPFPKFVIGFGIFILGANLGLLNETQITSLEHASNWLFLLAFVGLGLNIDLEELRHTDLTPVLLVLISLVTVSVLSLFLITMIL